MKAAISELAILGGAPSFEEPLHVGRPNVGDREVVLRAIDEAMGERWLSNNGAKLLDFERRLSEQLGGLHCHLQRDAGAADRPAGAGRRE